MTGLIKDPSSRSADDADSALAARAAWLHFSGGLTQGQVAKRLGVSGIKAHRLIARAGRDGLIRIVVDVEIAECVELEDKLCERYGLISCHVAPDLAEGVALPLKALGLAGAHFLRNEIERGETELIGIGHGRTLAAAVSAMPQMAAGDMRFVSVFGGLTRRFAANPHDVIHRLAEKTGAEAFQIPLPVFANSIEDKAVLLAQRGIAEVFDLACSAPLVFAGIGDLTDQAFLTSSQMVSAGELAQLHGAGAVGELLGHYFDEEGRVVAERFSERALSLGLAHLKKTRVVALAGGAHKITAVQAVLRSGTLDGLIIDEATARAIAEAPRSERHRQPK